MPECVIMFTCFWAARRKIKEIDGYFLFINDMFKEKGSFWNRPCDSFPHLTTIIGSCYKIRWWAVLTQFSKDLYKSFLQKWNILYMLSDSVGKKRIMHHVIWSDCASYTAHIQWEKVWWSALDIIKYYNGLSKKFWKDICHFEMHKLGVLIATLLNCLYIKNVYVNACLIRTFLYTHHQMSDY